MNGGGYLEYGLFCFILHRLSVISKYALCVPVLYFLFLALLSVWIKGWFCRRAVIYRVAMCHQPDRVDQKNRGLETLDRLTNDSIFFLLRFSTPSSQKSLAQTRMTPWWPEGSTACLEWDERRDLGWASRLEKAEVSLFLELQCESALYGLRWDPIMSNSTRMVDN